MKHHYKSMQEELEARKAAGEFGNMTEYDRRYRRDDPERYRRIAGPNAGVRSGGTASASRKGVFALESKLESALREKSGLTGELLGELAGKPSGKRKGAASRGSGSGRAGESSGAGKSSSLPRLHPSEARRNRARNTRSGKVVAMTVLITSLMIITACFMVIGLANRMSSYETYQEPDDFEAVVLDENASAYDAEDLIFSIVDSDADVEELNRWAEKQAYPLIDEYMVGSRNYAYWRSSQGVLLINVWYDRDRSTNDVGGLLGLDEKLRDQMDSDGIKAPCAMIVTDYETDELLMVLLDGDMLYGVGEFADLQML